MTAPLLELGGRGAPLLLCPANGFPPATYASLLRPLTHSHRVVCLPPRALWPDRAPPPDEAGSWTLLADDLLAGLEAHRLPPVVALGHSFGAVAALIAAGRDPARFRGLVMLDPTMLPPALMDSVRTLRARGEEPRFGLIEAARRRRARFASPEEAFAYWRGKELFADWPDAALHLYVEGMLRPAPDGEGFELAWSPEWEAWYYRSFYPDSWRDLERLAPGLPVLVVRGALSDTFVEASERHFRALRPGAEVKVVPGAGHLFPQSHAAEAAAAVRAWLSRLPAAA